MWERIRAQAECVLKVKDFRCIGREYVLPIDTLLTEVFVIELAVERSGFRARTWTDVFSLHIKQ